MRDTNSKMPPEIGKLYDGLYRELAWFRRTLEVTYDLYVDKPANVELLNDMAPDFFGFLQDTLVDSLIVRLSRMTDPERMGRFDNLSFKKLLALVDETAYPSIHSAIQSGIAKLEQLSSAARDHRNKRVAHSDLVVATSPMQLPNILMLDFKNALKAAHEILNVISSHFDGYEVSERVAPAPGGTDSLLLALKRASESKAADSFRYFMWFDRNSKPSNLASLE